MAGMDLDYYVRGIGNRFEWRQVLETLEAGAEVTAVSELEDSQ